MLFWGAKTKVFGVDIEYRSQQDRGRLFSKLPAAPQILLFNTTPQRTSKEKYSQHLNTGATLIMKGQAHHITAFQITLITYGYLKLIKLSNYMYRSLICLKCPHSWIESTIFFRM